MAISSGRRRLNFWRPVVSTKIRNATISFHRPSLGQLHQFNNERVYLAFDSSALLDILRYSKDEAQPHLEFLERNERRLFIPSTVGAEFSRLGPTKVYESINWFTSRIPTIFPESMPIHDRASFDVLIQNLESYRLGIEAEVEGRYRRILDLVHSRVGPALDPSKLSSVLASAPARYVAKIPPGYKDAGKASDVAFNDLVIWHELMDAAQRDQRSVVFFTNDRKSDWWLRSDEGALLQARVELIAEFKAVTGQDFTLMLGGALTIVDRIAAEVTATLPLLGSSFADYIQQQNTLSATLLTAYERITRNDVAHFIDPYGHSAYSFAHWFDNNVRNALRAKSTSRVVLSNYGLDQNWLQGYGRIISAAASTHRLLDAVNMGTKQFIANVGNTTYGPGHVLNQFLSIAASPIKNIVMPGFAAQWMNGAFRPNAFGKLASEVLLESVGLTPSLISRLSENANRARALIDAQTAELFESVRAITRDYVKTDQYKLDRLDGPGYFDGSATRREMAISRRSRSRLRRLYRRKLGRAGMGAISSYKIKEAASARSAAVRPTCIDSPIRAKEQRKPSS